MRRPIVGFGLAAGLYFLLTIALTWPLVLHPGSVVPNDLGDSLLNTFLLAWNARILPLSEEWWHLPQFYPVQGATAFSEHLLGLSVLTTPVIWATGNALLGYNVAFFLSFPLCALAAHALCYELTRRHDISLIAGIAYGFAPYRMSQLSHVQVLSAYWIPLALLGLHLFLRRGQWRWAVLFAVSWWLQSLANGYLLFFLSVLVGLWLIWFVVARRRWADLGRILVIWSVAALAFAPVAYGYLKWQQAYGFRRWPDEIQAFSADIASVLTASTNLRVWGWLSAIERSESQLFPGFTLIALVLAGIALSWAAAARLGVQRLRLSRIFLALGVLFAVIAATPGWFGPWKVDLFGIRLLSVGTPQKPLSIALLSTVIALALHPSIRAGWSRRSPLAFYTIAAAVMWLFSLGPSPTLLNQPLLYKAPYSWLMLVPGVDGIRVPARFWVLSTLCLAIAGALASLHIVTRWPALRSSLPALLAALMLVESWPQPVDYHRPPASRPAHSRANLRLELPSNGTRDLQTLFRAVEHRRPVFNGYSGHFAPHYWALQYLLSRHDPAALSIITSLGTVEAVVDHDQGGAGDWIAYLSAFPFSEVVHKDEAYTAVRLPRTTSGFTLPEFSGQSLPIAGIRASLYQDLVGLMTDGDRISRWHTGGPQDPTNEMTIDLGASKRLEGLEMQIGGYVADFPRALTIELSDDDQTWRSASTGSPGEIALIAALKEPFTVPLRFVLKGQTGRYIRLRQTSSDPVFYWSISELRVLGD
jgi:hypothetical protein